jgi:hypothetical protein
MEVDGKKAQGRREGACGMSSQSSFYSEPVYGGLQFLSRRQRCRDPGRGQTRHQVRSRVRNVHICDVHEPAEGALVGECVHRVPPPCAHSRIASSTIHNVSMQSYSRNLIMPLSEGCYKLCFVRCVRPCAGEPTPSVIYCSVDKIQEDNVYQRDRCRF